MSSSVTLRRIAVALAVFLSVTVAVQTVSVTAASSTAPHDDPQATDGNVTLLRGAGEEFAAIDDGEDFRRALDDRRLRPPKHLVPGDLLVLQFTSARAGDIYARSDGTDLTDRFFEMLEDTGVALGVEERDHGTMREPTEFRLNRSNVAVLSDSDNGTFTLLVDTGAVSLVGRDGGGPRSRSLAHSTYEAVVRVPDGDDDRRVLTGTVGFEPREVTAESPEDGVFFRHTPATIRRNATGDLIVTGNATVLPGSTLEVEAIARNGTVLDRRRIETRPPGPATDRFGHSVFETTLSTDRLGREDAFDLVVSDGEAIHERRVVVGEPPRIWNASAELVTDDERGDRVRIRSTLRVPDDGYVSVYSPEDDDRVIQPIPGDERVRATLYADPDAVAFEDGTVRFAVVWDADGDGVDENSASGPNDDRTFRARTDDGGAHEFGDFSRSVSVAGWPSDPRPVSASATATVDRLSTADIEGVADSSSSPDSTASPDSESTPTVPTVLGLGVVVLGAIGTLAVARYVRG